MNTLFVNVIVIYLYLYTLVSSQDDWFGTNPQYMCHCEQQKCDNEGNCRDDSKCQKEWFGPKCQYQDLTQIDVNQTSSIDNLFDRNDSSCINDQSSPIFISWNNPIVFTWLRLVVNDTSKHSQFTLQFYKDLRTAQTFFNCSNRHHYIVNNKTLDIQCDVQDVIRKIEIHGKGVPYLCSLYVNGGRNIALKQPSSQTSTFTLSDNAYLAVDGIINQNYSKNPISCSHTKPDDGLSTESWTVNIPLAQITRYVIYNREDKCTDGCTDRLNNFQIIAFGDRNSSFSYNDTSIPAKLVTTILDNEKHNISRVTIQLTGNNRILTLCEVQIFGECVPGTWGLNCEKTCSDQCTNKDCILDNRQCYGSCIGNNISPMCQQGPWFGNDNFLCHCDSWSSCDFNGICEQNQCAVGWFGYKCQYQDLATLSTAKMQITPNISSSVLTDRDDSTCITGKYDIIISWNTTYPFSWIRLKMPHRTRLGNVNLMFGKTADSTSQDIMCNNQRVIHNKDRTVDIRCDINETIQQLRIFHLENICSLYVNGGRNVALNQPATQSSTYSENGIYYGADKAVDGNRNGDFNVKTCSHTIKSMPQFDVTFPRVLVYRIDVYNRFGDFSNRLSSFQLALLDGTTLTFRAQAGDATAKTIISFYPNYNTSATKVTLSSSFIADSDEAFLTLCEVEVFGECVPGTYGLNCDNNCSDRCYNSQCNRDTGECEVFPLECPHGTWGPGCNETCSVNCLNQKCHATTGVCVEGCDEGYNLDYCNETCDETYFGRNCFNSCSLNCRDQLCDKFNGTCDECDPGFMGDFCQSACESGKWGPECNETCSVNCFKQMCNATTGVCVEGCNEGYLSDYCNETCNEIQYGRNCFNVCSVNCKDHKCNRFNGTCFECVPGYQGDTCNAVCEHGQWGSQCNQTCNSHCFNQTCNATLGICDKGCEVGYHSDYCNETCDEYHYGKNCLNNCSISCQDNKCHAVDGSCISCPPGFIGHICVQKCSKNNYGQECSRNCSVNCMANINNSRQTCHHVNGSCFNGCTDGYYTPLCTQATEDHTPIGAIVGSIIATLTAAALITGAAILWRKRKSKPKAFKSENQRLANLNQTNSANGEKSKESGVEESDIDSLENNINIELTSIPVQELSLFMLKQRKQFLNAQFKKIPAPRNVSTEIALSDENKNKNRYKNICPYDHSRVHLKINTGKKEGDYINASYIRGYKEESKFIAAQGPNNLVINDFVRMLWEQNIKKVVMLTNLIEEGKVKCEKYWPDSGKVIFGEIEVKLIQTQTFADYYIRKIELSKQAEESHIITHFHFTSWPDQNVPYAPWALLDFQQRVFQTPTSSFIVVHCSAGVGRTGTFIALCNVLRQAEETGQVDFFSTVTTLREDRTLMIQTADQYEFLHIAAQAALACMGTTVTASNIRERLKHLEEREVSGLTMMKKEFQAVDNVCKGIRNSHKDDLKEDDDSTNNTYQNIEDLKNCEKNRFPSIVPRNADRPYLTGDSNAGDYINAVFIPGLQKKDQHILTQLPMPTTVVDFWRLVIQYKVSLVVAFQKDKMATDTTIAACIPTINNMSLNFMPFDIKCDNFKEDVLWDETTLTVCHEKSKAENHTLNHLQCKFSDLSSRKLTPLIRKIRSYNVQTDRKILYMCRNGATYSGLCCAASHLLDRLDNDSCCSVPLVVSLMKTIRPEVIPSVEQYKLLYDVLERYTDISNPYTNVDENFFPKGMKQTKVNSPTSADKVSTTMYNKYNSDKLLEC